MRTDIMMNKLPRWVGLQDNFVSYQQAPIAAPMFRREFTYADKKPTQATVRFCGLGYGQLYLNGALVTDGELEPSPSQYDKRCLYRTYQVQLVPGANAFGVILGNGPYNSEAEDAWGGNTAIWRSNPKFFLELVVKGKVILEADSRWRYTQDGPIRQNIWHCGEVYDYTKELPGWDKPGFDDSAWKQASVLPGPGGDLEEDPAPPVRVVEEFPITEHIGDGLWDAGRVISGRVIVKARGEAGTKIRIRYSDILAKDGTFTQVNLGQFIHHDDFQTEYFVLGKDREREEWHSRFAFHCFRYVEVTMLGNAELLGLKAQVMRTDFEQIAQIETSLPDLNALNKCNLASYEANFVGYPTDCPHREKNGWTGDAWLGSDTGLDYYASATAYQRWIADMAAAQRLNGQTPAIVPCPGWGYNYGSGPLWDAALWEIPWNVYLHTGDSAPIKRHFDSFRRHLEYTASLAENGIITFGLGDLGTPNGTEAAPVPFVLTATARREALRLAEYAKVLGRETGEYLELAKVYEAALLREYPNLSQTTSLAIYAYEHIGPRDAARRLAAKVRENAAKADYGILGAKLVPRVLAQNGYIDEALELLIQPEYPGYVNWLRMGATTLWEYWDGSFSHAHVMFGDLASFMMQYLAGIKPDKTHPGFSFLDWKPCFPQKLAWLKASSQLPTGKISVSWKRTAKGVKYEITLPVPGKIFGKKVAAGKHTGIVDR